MLSHLAFFFAKFIEIFACFLVNILIPNNLLFLYLIKDDDFLSKENKTKGGERESAVNEFTVFHILSP